MKVLVWLESVGYGQAALGWYVVQALRDLGHEVQVCDYADYARPIPCTILEKLLRRAQLALGPHPLDRQMNHDLLARVQEWRPDLLLVTKGNPIAPRTLERIREAGQVQLFNWVPDDPFHRRYASRWLRQSIPLYHQWLLPIRSWEAPMRSAGATGTLCLPFACEPAVHRRVQMAGDEALRWKSQVCFVGTGYPERAALLEHLTAFDLAVWGERWIGLDLPRTSAVHPGWGIYMDDMARAYSAADLVLNIPQAQAGTGLNMRTFEVLGCGAFLLDERKPEGLELFAEGSDWVCYGDADEMVAQVWYYLDHPQERVAVARQGQAAAYGRHTYRHRMAKVMDLARSQKAS